MTARAIDPLVLVQSNTPLPIKHTIVTTELRRHLAVDFDRLVCTTRDETGSRSIESRAEHAYAECVSTLSLADDTGI